MRGRLRIAAVMMVCLVAILALPTAAHAVSGAPFASEYPAPGATLHASPSVVAVDLIGVTVKSGATITVNGQACKTYAVSGTDAGSWTSAEVDNGNGYFTIHWTWNPVVGGSGKVTLYCYPSTLGVGGPYAVAVAATQSNGTALSDSWDFSVASNVNPVIPPSSVEATTVTCLSTGCHAGQGWETDNGMGALGTKCTFCHSGGFAPHGFAEGTASGHNTYLLGTNIGAKTKFDGTQGSTLTWTATQAFTITSSKVPAAMATGFGPGTAVSLGQTGTVTTDWAFPTKSVFWPANDSAAPAGAMTGLSATSVITCEDCHSSIAAGGPHGESDNWALDAAFPGDYSMAGLTKKVTSGGTMPSGAYSPSGIMVATGAGATPAAKWAVSTAWADGTSGANAVICAKCHKLMTVMPAGTGPGTSGLAWDVAVGANTAHNSHHQDQTDGTPQCVSCHVAIPHGWKAPRLLVDVAANEGTPYVSENAIEEMGTLAALNNHPLVPADGTLAYSTGNGAAAAAPNVALSGTVLWDESQCDACGDHYGNSKIYVVGATGAATDTVTPLMGSAVPVRIDQR